MLFYDENTVYKINENGHGYLLYFQSPKDIGTEWYISVC